MAFGLLLNLVLLSLSLGLPSWAHRGWKDTCRIPLTIRTQACANAMFAETPRQVTGPFLTGAPKRVNVTEGRPGAPLELTVRVVDRNCDPVDNASVVIWHTDAAGVYSGFVTRPNGPGTPTVNTTGEDFMRGIQTTNANGNVTFSTLIPGWYSGRPVHIHFLVAYGAGRALLNDTALREVDGTEQSILVSQLYFKNDFLAEVFGSAEYESRGPPTTLNEDENVPEELILDVVSNPSGGYMATYTVAIDYDSKAAEPEDQAGNAPTSSEAGGTTAPQSGSGPLSEESATTTAMPSTTGAAESDSAACFPGDAYVDLEDGRRVPMHALSVGTRVHVGDGVYEEVFAFTHKLPAEKSMFLGIRVESGEYLEVSPGHYLVSSTPKTLVVARNLVVGDQLKLGSGGISRISEIIEVSAVGLYNPQTLGVGNIVVNGIVSSTYTEAVKPSIARSLLAPVRMFYQASGGFDATFSLLEKGGAPFGLRRGLFNGEGQEIIRG